MDLALDNLKWLICHKTKPNQSKQQQQQQHDNNNNNNNDNNNNNVDSPSRKMPETILKMGKGVIQANQPTDKKIDEHAQNLTD